MPRRTSSVRAVGVLGLLFATGGPAAAASLEPEWLDAYRPVVRQIADRARADRFAWDRLAELTDTFGPRLAGSQNLEAAFAWAAEQMKKDGLENVRFEPVMVPHWVRGRESAEIVEPFPSMLTMLGLGLSVGTPPEGIQAEVLVVKSFDELEARSAEARGRIVLFNEPFEGYGRSVTYRSSGASRAAKYGAVAALIRSVGLTGLRTPHTGMLSYDSALPKIPAAALPAEDAERLQRMQNRGQRVVLRLKMEAQSLEDVPSSNLVAEIPGRERPGEIVLLGCHLDSWDVGSGAFDDGVGCVAVWDALRVVRTLGLRPRRTLRVVLFNNEENGLRGATAYRDRHAAELADHVLAVELDIGAGEPRGFGFTGSDEAQAAVHAIAGLLTPLGASQVKRGGGGGDIGPSVKAGSIPSMSLDIASPNYFLHHHTPADMVDHIDPAHVSLMSASVAAMAYVVADMPARLDEMRAAPAARTESR
jgi:carboxypeptidase Q